MKRRSEVKVKCHKSNSQGLNRRLEVKGQRSGLKVSLYIKVKKFKVKVVRWSFLPVLARGDRGIFILDIRSNPSQHAMIF